MRNSKGYKDPTADIAIGNILKEERKRKRSVAYETAEPFAPRQKASRPHMTLQEQFDLIDKENK